MGILTASLIRPGHGPNHAASVGSLDGGMTFMQTLAYDYEYPPVVHLLGNAVAGWVIVGIFLALMTMA